MVDSTTALWFTLAGTAVGAILGFAGTLGATTLQVRHERRMFWLERRQQLFAELASKARELRQAAKAFDAYRGAGDDAGGVMLATNVADCLRNFRLANSSAELVASGKAGEARDNLLEATKELAYWLGRDAGGAFTESLQTIEPVMVDRADAIEQFDRARLAFVETCRKSLGIS